MLSEKIDIEVLKDMIRSREDYMPYPSIDNRGAWEKIPEALKPTIIKGAEKWLNFDHPLIKATDIFAYYRTGRLEGFDRPFYWKRDSLAHLLFGECLENKGRFLDDLINVVWSLCEHTTWIPPGHYSLYNKPEKLCYLPPVDDYPIDLVVGDIGIALAYIYRLMKPVLDEVTPVICQRIRYELEKRVIYPYLEREDMWWMGFKGNFVNNWAPWCASNCLMVTLLMEDDPYRRAEAVHKTIKIVNHFINVYHEEGGCDEGTTYWGRAGGSLFDCLEILYSCTGGQMNIFDQPLIKNIGEFLTKVHIADHYFVNFADGKPQVSIDSLLVFRYGQRVGSKDMMCLARDTFGGVENINPAGYATLRGLPYLFDSHDFIEFLTKDEQVDIKLNNTLRGIQVASYREKTDKNDGLYLAAKGGYNDESHNHNDIGHFVIYADGRPAIIDVGCGTYTKDTFSANRYKIWTMQSKYHNVPEINGYQQPYGRKYTAKNVSYNMKDDKSSYALDIAGAYKKESHIKEWIRTCELVRKPRGQIIVEDRFILERATDNVKNIMMTCHKPSIEEDGRVVIPYAEKKYLDIIYDSSKLEVSVEEFCMKDQQLIDIWNNQMFRIVYKMKECVVEDTHRYCITIKK